MRPWFVLLLGVAGFGLIAGGLWLAHLADYPPDPDHDTPRSIP